jgi:hypothetical protein
MRDVQVVAELRAAPALIGGSRGAKLPANPGMRLARSHGRALDVLAAPRGPVTAFS